MGEVYNYDLECAAYCPLTGKACRMECELQRPRPFDGEPMCSLRVIADELVNIDSRLRKFMSEERSV